VLNDEPLTNVQMRQALQSLVHVSSLLLSLLASLPLIVDSQWLSTMNDLNALEIVCLNTRLSSYVPHVFDDARMSSFCLRSRAHNLLKYEFTGTVE